jgi:hypothetical protein
MREYRPPVGTMKMKLINLRERFAGRFKIDLDEAAFCETGGKKNPWYYRIACRYGDIYPYSNSLLGFHCVGEKIRSRLRKEHPELEYLDWSDDGECVFLFRPDQFDMIATYAKPKRKRRISKKRSKQLAEAGCDTRFVSQNHGVQFSSDDRQATNSASRSSDRGTEN